MVNEIERVFSIVDALETKKAQHIAQRKTLEAERSTIALDAFAGNDKARKRLDSINASIATQASELAADAAIAKANERVTALRQEQAQAQAKEVAREILKRANALTTLAQTLDDANADIRRNERASFAGRTSMPAAITRLPPEGAIKAA
jgi:hypothetical protein